MNRLFCLVFLSICILWIPLFGQNVYYEHFNTHNGLPSSEVYDVKQDKQGFIWFATDRGICRYDGTNFKTYTTADGLIGNVALKIWKAKDILVFVMHNRGFMMLKDGQFYHDNFIDTSLYNFCDGDFKTICLHPEGNLYYANHKEIRVLNIFSKKLLHYSLPDIVYTQFLPTKTIDQPNFYSLKFYTVDCGENGQFRAFMYSKNVIKQNKLENWDLGFALQLVAAKQLKKNAAKLGYRISNTQILHFFGGYQLFFDYKTKEFSYQNEAVSIIERSFLSKNHLITVTTNNIFIDSFSLDIELKNVTSAFLDNEENLWIATLNQGIYKFSNYLFKNKNGLKEKQILKLIKYNKEILAIDESGIGYLVKEKLVKKFDMGDNFKNYWVHHDSLFLNRGIYVTKQFSIVNYQKGRVSGGSSKYFSFNNAYYIFYGVGVIELYEKKTGKFLKRFFNSGYNTDAILLGDCFFYSTSSGLYCVNLNFELSKIQDEHLDIVDPLFSKRINAIKWHKELLFLSSHGSGVIIYDYKNKKVIKRITTKDGLLSNTVNCVSFDENNNMFCGHTMGISKLKLSENFSVVETEIATEKDGFVNAEINDILVSNQIIYCATKTGVQTGKIEKIFKRAIFPPFTFNSVKISDSVYAYHEQKIELSHKQNSILINYSAPYFSYSAIKEFASYKYALIQNGEKDTIWNYTNQNFVQYTNLNQGNYIFAIKVANKNGIYSSTTYTLKFVVMPKFTQTIWFFLLGALCLSLIASLIYRSRIRNIKLAKSYENEIQKAQLNTLKAQMNPHFVFNSLNSIQNFIYKNEKLEANEYIVRFSQLMRKSVKYSSEEFIKIADEINYIQDYLYLEAKRFEDKIVYEVINNLNLDIEDFAMPPLMIQPTVENCIKHAFRNLNGPFRISVTFNESVYNEFIEVEISDNGAGIHNQGEFEFTQNNKGIGVNNLMQRIKLMNTKLENKQASFSIRNNEEATGVTVKLVLPIINLWE